MASVMYGEVWVYKGTPGWRDGGSYFLMEMGELYKNRAYLGEIWRVDSNEQKIEQLYLDRYYCR